MGQHTHLAAMMRVVRDHVSHHGWACGPRFRPTVSAKRFDPAPGKGVGKHLGTARAAFQQGGSGLLLRAGGAVEWGWELEMRGGLSSPFATHVMDVRDDGGDRSSLTPGQFGAPRSGIEMLEDNLIHLLVYGVTFHQRLAKIVVNVSL
jgi:hypothetical protein